MPITSFDEENRQSQFTEYPKLVLAHGDKARVVIIGDPISEYRHTLRAPIIVGGVAQMETATTKAGDEFQRMKKEFIAGYMCAGTPEALKDRGIDPENCLMCAASLTSDGAIPEPEIRFIMHVIKYSTKPGSFEITEPFQVALYAWTFGISKWNELLDLKKEARIDKMSAMDLMLGPCTQATFQNYDIKAGSFSEWNASPERQQVVASVFQNNKHENLSDSGIIARKYQAEKVADDIQKVLHRTNVALGGNAGVEDTPQEIESGLNLTAALDLPVSSEQAPAVTPEPAVTEAVVAEVATETEAVDLDALLDRL